MFEIKILEMTLLNHTLTDYLRESTDLELEYYQKLICSDDIQGVKIDILSAVKNEMEYRKRSKKRLIKLYRK